MEKKYSFKPYAPSLTEKETAINIYNEIVNLDPEQNHICIDFSDMIAMTTICARLIFGKLYILLGREKFHNNIIFKGVTDLMQISIKIGIEKEIEFSFEEN